MTSTRSLPADHLDAAKMPGHWLLAASASVYCGPADSNRPAG
jgi:hypothetical protein